MVAMTTKKSAGILRCILCTRSCRQDSPLATHFWHKLPVREGRFRTVDICGRCWEEVRDNPAPSGALAPTVYIHGTDDGDDHCSVCGAMYDGHAVGGKEESKGWHTHLQCYEEGINIGAQGTDIENGCALAARIGVQGGYFDEVLKMVPEDLNIGEWQRSGSPKAMSDDDTHENWYDGYEDYARCPHCGEQDVEICDYGSGLQNDGDSTEFTCANCEKGYTVTMCVTYTFATIPLFIGPKRNYAFEWLRMRQEMKDEEKVHDEKGS